MVVMKYQSNGITIEISHGGCVGCSECRNACPADVFEMVDGKATAPNIEECTECCLCVGACITKAITHSSC